MGIAIYIVAELYSCIWPRFVCSQTLVVLKFKNSFSIERPEYEMACRTISFQFITALRYLKYLFTSIFYTLPSKYICLKSHVVLWYYKGTNIAFKRVLRNKKINSIPLSPVTQLHCSNASWRRTQHQILDTGCILLISNDTFWWYDTTFNKNIYDSGQKSTRWKVHSNYHHWFWHYYFWITFH